MLGMYLRSPPYLIESELRLGGAGFNLLLFLFLFGAVDASNQILYFAASWAGWFGHWGTFARVFVLGY